jgi:hypothetical protein
MMQTPPISIPAHGCVPVVGVDVVVVGGTVVVVVAGLVVVVVGGAVVVVVAGLVVVVVGAAVVVVVAGLVVVVVGAAVVVVELAGGVVGSLDGTHSPKPSTKNRRGFGATRAAKQTRSVGPAVIGCGLDG